MKKPKVNTSLRRWARGVSFTISMGRCQVYAIISVHLSVCDGRFLVGFQHRHMNYVLRSIENLSERGLLTIGATTRRAKKDDTDASFYRLTRAGELLIGLLQEAGIYDEVRAELEAADKPRLRIA